MAASRQGEGRNPRAPRRSRAPRASRALRSPIGIALAAVLLATAGTVAYVVARETSIFALERIEVDGAPPEVAGRVRGILESDLGRSLVAFDAGAAGRRLTALPEISAARFDRAFPHTLTVEVTLERPVAILRRGSEAWLVSARARVLRQLEKKPYPRLPRIWVPRTADVAVNATLSGPGARGVRALAPSAPARIRTAVRQVRAGDDELTLVLASGTELRLGDAGDIRLKLAIAARILPLNAGAAYVDVSVPERPVAGSQTLKS